jgi:hypothetical protein
MPKTKNSPKVDICRATTPILTVLGWLAVALPTLAYSDYYGGSPYDYRICTAELLRAGIAVQPASQACAEALYPKDLSACVSKIGQQTKIAPADALPRCSKARRPEDLRRCVVALSQNTQQTVDPTVLDYCSRSLLPVRFAQCVVGLRTAANLAPSQALDNCIDASDFSVTGFSPLPSFIPANTTTPFQPTFETTPTPANPNISPLPEPNTR